MRREMDLCGIWRFQIDAYEDGDRLGYAEEQCDTRFWREARVPCAFDDIAPEMRGYEGVGWFRRTFTLEEDATLQYVALRFEGVNYNAQVWVNGHKAGEHRGGFLRFELPISHIIKEGRNSLAVRVDNTRRKGEVPGLKRGWRPYGGILREVYLIVADPLHLLLPVVVAGADGTLDLQVDALNEHGYSVNARVQVVLHNPEGEPLATWLTEPQTLPPGSQATFSLRVKADVVPWSPESPVLYPLYLRLLADGRVTDEIAQHIGFRTIERRGVRLYLNGQPLYLRGFNRHEDTATTGMTPNPEQTIRDLQHIRSMGCNFVRLCHYPHHPATLDACDRLGLLVMAEIPLYWWDGLAEGEEASQRKWQAARQQLHEMIERDRNHPCIILWSVSNETAEERPEVAQGNARLVAYAKQMDPTRLATHVSDRWHRYPPHFEQDDVISVNAYPSWGQRCINRQSDYNFSLSTHWWREHPSALHERYPDRPILITEYGYPAHEGIRDNALSEDAQTAAILAEYEAFHEPYICGSAIWCYADHPWPEEDFIRYLTTSPFGIVTRDRREKAVCEHLRRAFRVTPTAVAEPEPSEDMYVRMVRPHLLHIPEVPFPEGFSVRPYQPGDERIWTDIWRDAEPFLTIDDDLFAREFGSDWGALRWRCFFIVDERGCAVGTVTAWYSRDFKGQDWGRIHWLAVRPAYQGRDLAKAALSFALKQLAQWHERVWLDTSSGRLAALKLYLDFGFVPDMDAPGARVAWQQVQQKLNHPVLAQYV